MRAAAHKMASTQYTPMTAIWMRLPGFDASCSKLVCISLGGKTLKSPQHKE